MIWAPCPMLASAPASDPASRSFFPIEEDHQFAVGVDHRLGGLANQAGHGAPRGPAEGRLPPMRQHLRHLLYEPGAAGTEGECACETGHVSILCLSMAG